MFKGANEKEKNQYRCRTCGAPKRGHVCSVNPEGRGKGRYRPFESDLNHLIHRIEDLERDLMESEEENARLRKRLTQYEAVDLPARIVPFNFRQMPIKPATSDGSFVFVPYRGPAISQKRRRSMSSLSFEFDSENAERTSGSLSPATPPLKRPKLEPEQEKSIKVTPSGAENDIDNDFYSTYPPPNPYVPPAPRPYVSDAPAAPSLANPLSMPYPSAPSYPYAHPPHHQSPFLLHHQQPQFNSGHYYQFHPSPAHPTASSSHVSSHLSSLYFSSSSLLSESYSLAPASRRTFWGRRCELRGSSRRLSWKRLATPHRRSWTLIDLPLSFRLNSCRLDYPPPPSIINLLPSSSL